MSKKNAPKKSETTVSKVVESPSESEFRSVSEGNSIASGGGFFSRWRQRASLRLKGPVCRLRLKKTAAGAVALSAIGVLGYFGYGFYADYVSVPTVEGANFSLEYRKIPFDVPSVDFIYSTDLDAASIIPANVTVSPAVAGSPALSKSNVVSFVLSEKLKVGSKYVFTLSKEIASKSGKKASKDTIVELEAVGGVAVSRAIPTGETENLSKNPIFIFNIPIVALATLAEKDKLPCPLKFEPALPGRCSWIAGNVLEYVLEKPMTPATKYQVVLSSSSGFLYPMKEEFKTEFSTFRLKAVSDNAVFSPRNGINLSFNADVSKTELEKKLSLKDSASGAPIPAKVDAVGGADVSNSFVITGKDGPLPHSKKYAVSVSAGLLSVGANLPLEKNADFVYESANFIRNVEVKYKIFSETGALLDTPGIYSDGTKDMISVIPAKNGILTIDFDEDVDFVKDSVYLAESGGKKIADCELSSFERQVDLPPVSGEPDAANKASYTSLKCEPKTDLPYGEFVNLIVTPAASKSLRDIAFKAFAVSKEFKVSDFKLLSPTEACLYSTTTLESNAEGLVIEPKAVVRDFSPDGTYEWRDGRNSMRYACPVLEGKKAYVA